MNSQSDLLLSEQDAVHGFKGTMSSSAKPASYGYGQSPLPGSARSTESKHTLVSLPRPSVSSTQLSSVQLLRKRNDSVRSRKDSEHSHFAPPVYNDEEFRSCKVSFSDTLPLRPLDSRDSGWMRSDYPAVVSTPQPPPRSHAQGQTVRSKVSIRELRYRVHEEQAGSKSLAPSIARQTAPQRRPSSSTV